MKVTLPWPSPRVTPNAKRRSHWRSYQPAIKADRATGHTLTTVALSLHDKKAIAEGEGKIPVTIRFFPPDRRHRDADGMIGAAKHLLDGVADAIGVNDRRFLPHFFFEEPCKPGRVEVHFSPETNRERFPASGGNAMENERGGERANVLPPLTDNHLVEGGD